MSKAFSIFHVDDEPDRVSWIPVALRNAYYLNHAEYLPTEDEWEEIDDDNGRQTFTFILKGAGQDKQDVTLRYILVTHELLLDGDDLSDALIILDVMRTEGDNLEPVAFQHYPSLIADGISPERIYMLTAYGGRLPESAFPGLPKGHVLEKPIDPGKMVNTLFAAMPGIAP